jgi:CTP synthase
MTEAHTTEIEKDTPFPVIDIMESQKKVENLGGTMRLGAYDCVLDPDSISHSLYNKDMVSERHRHRYEFNNDYREKFEKAGMRLAGINPEEDLVEIIELKDHPWFVGVQFHPEYKSYVKTPHPLFVGFVKAAMEYKHAKELFAVDD